MLTVDVVPAKLDPVLLPKPQSQPQHSQSEEQENDYVPPTKSSSKKSSKDKSSSKRKNTLLPTVKIN